MARRPSKLSPEESRAAALAAAERIRSLQAGRAGSQPGRGRALERGSAPQDFAAGRQWRAGRGRDVAPAAMAAAGDQPVTFYQRGRSVQVLPGEDPIPALRARGFDLRLRVSAQVQGPASKYREAGTGAAAPGGMRVVPPQIPAVPLTPEGQRWTAQEAALAVRAAQIEAEFRAATERGHAYREARDRLARGGLTPAAAAAEADRLDAERRTLAVEFRRLQKAREALEADQRAHFSAGLGAQRAEDAAAREMERRAEEELAAAAQRGRAEDARELQRARWREAKRRQRAARKTATPAPPPAPAPAPEQSRRRAATRPEAWPTGAQPRANQQLDQRELQRARWREAKRRQRAARKAAAPPPPAPAPKKGRRKKPKQLPLFGKGE